MMDDKTTLKDLTGKIISFRDERGWEKNTSKDLAISIVLEAAELLEHFQWGHFERKDVRENEEKLKALRFEMADVLIYLFAFAYDLGIDITSSVYEKLEWNAVKYPLDRFNPRHQDREYYYNIKKEYRHKKLK